MYYGKDNLLLYRKGFNVKDSEVLFLCNNIALHTD